MSWCACCSHAWFAELIEHASGLANTTNMWYDRMHDRHRIHVSAGSAPQHTPASCVDCPIPAFGVLVTIRILWREQGCFCLGTPVHSSLDVATVDSAYMLSKDSRYLPRGELQYGSGTGAILLSHCGENSPQMEREKGPSCVTSGRDSQTRFSEIRPPNQRPLRHSPTPYL